MVVNASQNAYSVRHLAETYHQLSKAHFMNPLAKLDGIFALEVGSPELQQKKDELHNDCKRATEAIKAEVTKQQKFTSLQIRKRMQAIEDQMMAIIGEPEPEVVRIVQTAVEEVKQHPIEYAAPPPPTPVGVDPVTITPKIEELNVDDLI